MFNKEEIMWIIKCQENPERYRVDVDNDDISITDLKEEESIFTFTEFGYEFIVQFLTYIGINAETV